MKTALLLLLLLLGCGLGPSSPTPATPTEAPPLVFGLLPTESSTDAARRWRPLLAHLGAQIGRPIETVAVADYAALVEALRFEKADLAYLGPNAYVEAHTRAGAVPLAQELGKDGTKGYHAVIVTRSADPGRSLDDFAGRTFAFVEPNSASGYLVPLVHFHRERGVAPERFFSKVSFAGSHQAAILSVRAGHVDAAATNALDLDRAVQKGALRADELREIWRSALIPGSPIVARRGLDAAVRDRIRALLVEYRDPAALAALQSGGFAAVDDAAYEPVREMVALQTELRNPPK